MSHRQHSTSVQFFYSANDQARIQVIRQSGVDQVAIKFHDTLACGLTLYVDVDDIGLLIGVLSEARRQALTDLPVRS